MLPLAADDEIPVDPEEHLELRQAMDDVLLDLVDDPEIIGEHTVVIEIAGDPDERLAMLERHTGSSRTLID